MLSSVLQRIFCKYTREYIFSWDLYWDKGVTKPCRLPSKAKNNPLTSEVTVNFWPLRNPVFILSLLRYLLMFYDLFECFHSPSTSGISPQEVLVWDNQIHFTCRVEKDPRPPIFKASATTITPQEAQKQATRSSSDPGYQRANAFYKCMKGQLHDCTYRNIIAFHWPTEINEVLINIVFIVDSLIF